MKISDLLEPCKLKLVTGDPDREISGFYACDLLSWAISHAKEGDLWVTVMNNINILAVASLVEVACIVIPEGIEIPDVLAEKAREREVTLLSTPLQAAELIITAYELSKRIG
ncbi:MAG: AraC family transcriptional regulator [Clostridia bacterium]